MTPILDNFAYFLIGVACGAVTLFVFVWLGGNPLFLALCWLLMAVSWALGRMERWRRGTRNRSST